MSAGPLLTRQRERLEHEAKTERTADGSGYPVHSAYGNRGGPRLVREVTRSSGVTSQLNVAHLLSRCEGECYAGARNLRACLACRDMKWMLQGAIMLSAAAWHGCRCAQSDAGIPPRQVKWLRRRRQGYQINGTGDRWDVAKRKNRSEGTGDSTLAGRPTACVTW